MGSLGEKKWVIYIYCIDFPKSALAANQLLSSYTFLRRVATYRQKKANCFALSLLFHFGFSIFIQLGKRYFNGAKSHSEGSVISQSSRLHPCFLSCSLSSLAVIVSRANRCLH